MSMKHSFSASDPQEQINATLQKINALISRVEIENAIDLALSGEEAAAEEVLHSLSETDEAHTAFDLLARIKAQKGDVESARHYWNQALKINPGCEQCQAGLAKLASGRPSIQRNYIYVPLSILFILFCLYSLINIGDQNSTVLRQLETVKAVTPMINITAPAVSPDPALADLAAAQKRINDQLVNQENDLRVLSTALVNLSKPAPTEATPSPTPSVINSIKINVQGITTNRVNDSLIIQFSDGLFLFNWLLSPFGYDALQQIGFQLESYTPRIRIEVQGFTDDTERDQPDLVFFRANKVIEHLTQTTQLPKEIFTITAASFSTAPYPNSSIENRMKNRTAILTIKPKE